ncbi:MAG: glutamine amidotransferase [Burkholderiales bacterium]|nr:MAG: glutamine amidotransferase [Burkholderiales bacterium]
MKPFLILQLRPETEASDDEFEAILRKGGLRESETRRIRLDRGPIPADLDLGAHAAVIVGGGPACVSDPEHRKSPTDRQIEAELLKLMPRVTESDFPYLGCCYGIGILAHHLGASVTKDRYSEPVGAVDCQLTADGRRDPLLSELPERFRAFVGHKEAVQSLPADCVHLIASPPCPYQMIRYRTNVYATQFHPEADGDVFEVRIRVYRDRGYFQPEDADGLIAMCRDESVHVPERILGNFVNAYR